jgi:HSP20 family molecular chaperone IbpA
MIMKNLQIRKNNNYDLFDVFDDFFRPAFYDDEKELKTDIKETDTDYELDISVPGYTKDQIKVSLDNGYLTIACEKQEKEQDDKKHYIRREISESSQRSYYVGNDVTRADIKAKYENGILNLTIPKATPKQIQEQYIDIE